MKKTCKNCQYQREPGQGDEAIAGTGMWCSNSLSPLFLARVGNDDTCAMFSARGKKAGLGLRLKSKGLGMVNRVIGRKK